MGQGVHAVETLSPTHRAIIWMFFQEEWTTMICKIWQATKQQRVCFCLCLNSYLESELSIEIASALKTYEAHFEFLR